MGALKSYFLAVHMKSLVCPSGDIDGVTMNVGITPRDYAMNGFNWWITGNANAGIAWALKNSNGDTKGEPLKLIEIDNPQGLVYFGDKKRRRLASKAQVVQQLTAKVTRVPEMWFITVTLRAIILSLLMAMLLV